MTMHHAQAQAADPVLLHAAGSLRGALTEVAKASRQRPGLRCRPNTAPSGLLQGRDRRRREGRGVRLRQHGAPAALAEAGKSGPVVLFARNRLCALVRPGLAVDARTLLERMLDPAIKLGTSTPQADPSGDYAFEVFRKADRLKPGAQAPTLESKALQLTGGPASAAPPAGRSVYGWPSPKAGPISSSPIAPRLRGRSANIPASRSSRCRRAGGRRGLWNDRDGGCFARRLSLAMFMLSPDGQRLLAGHGFAAPNLPQ